jgi:hypothetical protein
MSARGRRRIGPWISSNAPAVWARELVKSHTRDLAVDAVKCRGQTDGPGTVSFSTASSLFRHETRHGRRGHRALAAKEVDQVVHCRCGASFAPRPMRPATSAPGQHAKRCH